MTTSWQHYYLSTCFQWRISIRAKHYDLAEQQIKYDPLHAKVREHEQLNIFVEERLLPCQERKVTFCDHSHKNKSLTFGFMHDTETKLLNSANERIQKSDLSILQRLVIAYDGQPKRKWAFASFHCFGRTERKSTHMVRHFCPKFSVDERRIMFQIATQ